MAESIKLGQGSCPVCASPKARYTLSKKQLICVTCDGCNVQVFARSDRSDGLLRQLIKAEAPAPVEVKNTLPAEPAAEDPQTQGDPPAPVPEPPAKPKQRGSLMSW